MDFDGGTIVENSADRSNDAKHAAADRKPYAAPELRDFGAITDLVQGLDNVGGDGGGPVDSATS